MSGYTLAYLIKICFAPSILHNQGEFESEEWILLLFNQVPFHRPLKIGIAKFKLEVKY
jgi:hypothetical protein